MGVGLDDDDLARRLAALADTAPADRVAGRSALVRRRVAVRRRRTAGAVAGLAAAVLLVAPFPELLPGPTDDAEQAPLAAAPSAPERVVATFSFPDQGAVAQVLQLPDEVEAGRTTRVVVRVRTERGRVGGVDLMWGDGRAAWLDGGARCTPDAGPTVVDLPAAHAWSAPGRYVVRAAPQVLTGCEEGAGRFSVAGAVPGQAEVRVR